MKIITFDFPTIAIPTPIKNIKIQKTSENTGTIVLEMTTEGGLIGDITRPTGRRV